MKIDNQQWIIIWNIFLCLFDQFKIQGTHFKQVMLLTSVIGDNLRILSWEGNTERLIN